MRKHLRTIILSEQISDEVKKIGIELSKMDERIWSQSDVACLLIQFMTKKRAPSKDLSHLDEILRKKEEFCHIFMEQVYRSCI